MFASESLLDVRLLADQPVESGIEVLLADRSEPQQRTERGSRRRHIELARRRQLGGWVDDAGEVDHARRRSFDCEQPIKANLAGGA